MNRQRLLTVRQNLIDHQNNGLIFDLTYWMKPNIIAYNEQEAICKTACCAVGLYILKNPDCGLKLVTSGNSFNYYPIPADSEASWYDTDYMPFKVIAEHFDITRHEAEELFDPGQYSNKVNPLLVVKRIDELLVHDGKG